MKNYLDFKLFEVSGTSVTVSTVVTSLLVVVVAMVVSRVLQKALVKVLNLWGIRHEGTVAVTRRLLHYFIMIAAFGVALETFGVRLSTLFAAGALLAVAVGFAMQNISQNFVSGVILLVERAIKPGDVLEVDGNIVKIVSMGIRATVARTLDDEELIIPNSLLVQNPVKNYTLRDSLYRLRAAVGVVYSSDLTQVGKVLTQVAENLAWRSQLVEPRILLRAFGSSSVDFEVSVWIDDPWRRQSRLSELNQAIWWALKEARITIAFPQLDVHFDAELLASLQSVRKQPELPAATVDEGVSQQGSGEGE